MPFWHHLPTPNPLFPLPLTPHSSYHSPPSLGRSALFAFPSSPIFNQFNTSNDKEELSSTVVDVNNVMLEGGFPLREWTSNEPQVLSSLSSEVCSENSEAKVLGYLYDAQSDKLWLKNSVLDCSANTKRKIVSSLLSVFDPLGIFNPVLLAGKLLIRSLSQSSSDWDDQIDRVSADLWGKCCKEFVSVSDLYFPRRTFSTDEPVRLFLFADASKEAYGCAIYAAQGSESSLVFAKVKLSPVKTRTLPTLELLASLMALKCLLTILEDGLFVNMNIESIVLFVDSQVVLSWILSNKAPRKNIFVSNRLKEISGMLDSVKVERVGVTFSYIPSLSNQADILTRPCSGKCFREKFDNWIKGPEWICSPCDEWPKGNLGCIPHSLKDELVSAAIEQRSPAPLIDVEHFSSFSELIRVASLVFKAVNIMRKVDRDPVKDATNYLLRQVQQEEFSVELDYLKSPSNKESPALVFKLNLFIDEFGVIRSRGRIDKNTVLKYEIVNPVLVPKKHHFTKLLVNFAHCSSMHMGLQATLNFLRMHGVWIVQARQAVKSVLDECIVCKRYNVPSTKYSVPASLPADRVNLSVPFSHTGVDYTGHIKVNGFDGNPMKVYILIFTCFNTRALHLEAVSSMTTSEFILAFIRFVNRYGVPSAVYSDNAKSFVQAGGVIEQLLSSSEFEAKFKIASIKHRTIPVYAAWYGASWERMIRTVKQCLFKAMGRNVPTYQEFVTLLSDVQKVINNRPLTYRSSENELDIITPNHFIVGAPIPSLLFGNLEQLPEWEYCDGGDYSTSLAKSLEYRDLTLGRFRDQWLREYLVSLRERDRSLPVKDRSWSVGEVALHRLPSKSRAFWPLCRVVETYPDAAGVVRTLKVFKPDRSESVVNVAHLVPLELFMELHEPALIDGEDSADPVVAPDSDALSDQVESTLEDGMDDHAEDNVSLDSAPFPDITDTGRPSRRTALASRNLLRSLARGGLV